MNQIYYYYRNCERFEGRQLGINFINPFLQNGHVIFRELGLFNLLRPEYYKTNACSLALMGRSGNSSTKIKKSALNLIMKWMYM